MGKKKGGKKKSSGDGAAAEVSVVREGAWAVLVSYVACSAARSSRHTRNVLGPPRLATHDLPVPCAGLGHARVQCHDADQRTGVSAGGLSAQRKNDERRMSDTPP